MGLYRFFRIKCLCLLPLLLTSCLSVICLADESSSEGSVRRLDPRTRELVKVEPEQIKPGKLYKHYSTRHQRDVWAFAKAGGGFSYALGVGSTELPENFDLPISKLEATEMIRAATGDWYGRSRSEGRQIYARLGADDTWQILRVPSIRSHFDIDHGQRWEWHGKRRVAVLHTHGNYWQYVGDRYVPANSYWCVASPL